MNLSKILFVCILLINLAYSQNLILDLSSSKAEYRYGEPVVFGFSIKNITNQKMEVAWPSFITRTLSLKIQNSDGEILPYVGPLGTIIGQLKLQPGEEYYFVTDVCELYGNSRLDSFYVLLLLAPGTYDASFSFGNNKEQISSNSIEVKILPPSSSELLVMESYKKVIRSRKNLSRENFLKELESLEKNYKSSAFYTSILEYILAILINDNEKEKYIKYINFILENYPESYLAVTYSRIDEEYTKKLVSVENKFWRKHFQQQLRHKEKE